MFPKDHSVNWSATAMSSKEEHTPEIEQGRRKSGYRFCGIWLGCTAVLIAVWFVFMAYGVFAT